MDRKSNDRSFDLVNFRYLNSDHVKLVTLTNSELNISQKRVHIPYNIDIGSDGDVMLLKVFKILFPNLT